MTSDSPEEHDRVARSVRGRLADHLDGLAVREDLFRVAGKCVCRPPACRQQRLFSRRRADREQHVFMGNDCRARAAGAGNDEPSARARTDFRDRVVAADVIEVGIAWFRMKRTGCSEIERRAVEHLRRRCSQAGINQDNAVLARLHDDIAAGAGDHRDVSLHAQHARRADGRVEALHAFARARCRVRPRRRVRLELPHELRVRRVATAHRTCGRNPAVLQEVVDVLTFRRQVMGNVVLLLVQESDRRSAPGRRRPTRSRWRSGPIRSWSCG